MDGTTANISSEIYVMAGVSIDKSEMTTSVNGENVWTTGSRSIHDRFDPLKGDGAIELTLYITLETVIAVLAFVNNLFIIIALWKFSSLRTPTNWFVASLAVADIAVAVIAIPSAILLRLGLTLRIDHCDDVIDGPSVNRSVCLLIVSVILFLTQVSIFSLLVIAIDRFIAINYPFRYRSFMTSNMTRACIVVAWGLGAAIGLIPEFGWNKWAEYEELPCDIAHCAFVNVISMEFMVYFNFFACVLTPLIVMGAMYILIFRSAKTQLQKIYSDVRKIKRRRQTRESLEELKLNTVATFTEFCNGCHGDSRKSPWKSWAQKLSLTPSMLNGGGRRADSRAESCVCTTTGQNGQIVDTGGESTNSLSVSQQMPDRANSNDSSKDNLLETAGQMQTITFTNKKEHLEDNRVALELGLEQAPRCKSHSFTASTTVMSLSPFAHSGKEYCRVNDPPLSKVTNGISPSGNSPHSTLYTSEHGVWSPVESRSGQIQHKMKRKSELLKKEFRAARSLATVVGLFAFCWLPLHTLNCVTLYYPQCVHPNWLMDLAILLSHANSLVNPLIYAFKLRDFRTAFRKILIGIFASLTRYCGSKNSLSKQSGGNGVFKKCCLITSQRAEEVPSRSVDSGSSSDDRAASSDSQQSKILQFNQKSADLRNNNNAGSAIEEEPAKDLKRSTLCIGFRHKKRKTNTSHVGAKIETEMSALTNESTSQVNGGDEIPVKLLPPSCGNSVAPTCVFLSVLPTVCPKSVQDSLLNMSETTL